MPKSKHGNSHKKRVAAYKRKVQEDRRLFSKRMKELNERYQQEMLDKEIAQGAVASETVEGLNVDDFRLEEEPELNIEPQQGNVGTIQGVTDPNQL